MNEGERHRIVVVGGGFGGLYVVRNLAHVKAQVTLVDKRNFHLFQPLLYQVASGALSAGNISVPFREIMCHQDNIEIRLDEVIDIDPKNRMLTLRDGVLSYDTLILAPGSMKQYFGHDDWENMAPGLKTIEDAVRVRSQVLLALESAEKEPDDTKRLAWLTFVVVGGGSTGVELAGALGELIHSTLKKSFRHIDTNQIRILMVEAGDQILAAYPPDLQVKAVERLKDLGVTILTGQAVKAMEPGRVTISQKDQNQEIFSETVIWTAGVKASPLGKILSDRIGCPMDKGGRMIVQPDCSVLNHPEIFVIGDLANYSHTPNQKPLPGLAAVAMQQGQYLAGLIRKRLETLENQATATPFYYPSFRYHDKGNLSIIGRNAAIAQIGNTHLSGFPAWVAWLLVHIFYLIGFDNKVLVTFQWAWNYLTAGRSVCLITEQPPDNSTTTSRHGRNTDEKSLSTALKATNK